MSEMVERVTAAIIAADQDGNYEAMARAAIAAMRDCLSWDEGDLDLIRWQIDAALSTEISE
jgi:hypothetical protein